MTENLFDLAGKTALVTGASSGIGEHFARALAAHGARVALGARRVDKLRGIADEINNAGGEAMAVGMDVNNAAEVDAAIEKVWGEFGAVNVLVNNAGMAVVGAAMELSEDEWDAVMDTNVKSAFFIAQNIARRLVAAGVGGSFINVTSIISDRAGAGVSGYLASKSALAHLTRALALEWAPHNIRVNAISPGCINHTELLSGFFESDAGREVMKKIPQGRIGEPKDLEGTLLLLASDASSFMTGSTIVVDGGHLQSSLT